MVCLVRKNYLVVINVRKSAMRVDALIVKLLCSNLVGVALHKEKYNVIKQNFQNNNFIVIRFAKRKGVVVSMSVILNAANLKT